MAKEHIKIIADNRKARFDYHVVERFEAGMMLTGTEVKALRQGKANLKDSYARIKKGEVFVYQLHISPYTHATYDNHDPLRPRKLLLHRQEIRQLFGKVNERGFTLVPLRLYFRDGLVKMELALAKGKLKYDKRDSIRRRDEQRDLQRQRKDYK
ncbi:MAG: SsrA-binding protein SmpB [Desulfobacteraceae bacterium]|nr:MAG: SsrA-binding protein SmpB [Desulfobacteraceae bacterium]